MEISVVLVGEGPLAPSARRRHKAEASNIFLVDNSGTAPIECIGVLFPSQQFLFLVAQSHARHVACLTPGRRHRVGCVFFLRIW